MEKKFKPGDRVKYVTPYKEEEGIFKSYHKHIKAAYVTYAKEATPTDYERFNGVLTYLKNLEPCQK
jgi:hypothetical protein